MSIHQNLRQLRHNCGITQEQVAQQVGITRQALSGYESGRTRPDVEMLLSLAKIYQTDLDGILYGQEKKLQAARRVHLTAAILFWVLTILTIINASFLLIANRCFPLSEGLVSSGQAAALKAHIFCNNGWKVTDSLIITVGFLGFTLLLLLTISEKANISTKAKILYCITLSVPLLTIAVLFAILDPVFSITRYIVTPLWMIVSLWIFLLLEKAVRHIRKA